MSTLYEITGNMKKLLQMADEYEIDKQALNDTLESLGCDLEDKAETYAKVIKQLEGQVKIISDEKQRLEERKKTITNNITRMKAALKEAMLVANKKKIKTNLFNFTIQKPGGVRAIVIDGEVPKEYLKQPEPDTTAIREFLKTNQVQWAHIKEPEEVLIIR